MRAFYSFLFVVIALIVRVSEAFAARTIHDNAEAIMKNSQIHAILSSKPAKFELSRGEETTKLRLF